MYTNINIYMSLMIESIYMQDKFHKENDGYTIQNFQTYQIILPNAKIIISLCQH
jgi:hypothetical protein